MDALTAALLGALQGVTEFLPVSSSGHVAIGALTLGVPDMPLSMVVLLHAGTLVATVAVFARDIRDLTLTTARGLSRPRELLASDDGKLVAGVVLASVPTAIIGLLFEDAVESWSHVPWIIGACLLVTAACVLSTRRGGGALERLPAWAYLLVGVVQGLAVLPGVSRSGSTIAAAMLLGLTAREAFRFSFLLSLPAVTGAVLLKLLEPGALAGLGVPGLVGGAVAMGTGYVALRVLQRLVVQGRFWAFAVYLVPLGAGLVVWDLLRAMGAWG